LKKKKIAIIELETHAFLLEQWFSLLNEMDSIDFHFFVHQKIKEKLTLIPESLITIVNEPNEINIYLDSYDAVIVNTLHRKFDQYQYIFNKKPVLCLIHNLNFSLLFKTKNWMNLILEKQSFLYYLKLYFIQKIAQRRKHILKASNYGVLSENIFQEIKSKNQSIAFKTSVISLYYSTKKSFISSDVINIVIPGNVSSKRKDIDLVFAVLPKLTPESRLHFIFLGKPDSSSILKKLEKLKQECNNNVTISYYTSYILWEEYSQVIAKSHLLLCPMRHKTSFYWVNEIYGKTKLSGSETDCIYNSKIGIFPNTYPKMNWHNLYYKNDVDLQSLLNSITFENLKLEYQKLNPFLEEYTFEKVKNELENQLLKLATK
jgi:glycosyltransferase involved in cell wall biosynthesis